MPNILRALAAALVALAASGCLLFTSVSDLGGDTASSSSSGSSTFAAAAALAHDAPGVVGIAVDGANVYWTNSTTGTLWRAPKASTDAASPMALDKPPTPGEVTVFNGRIYVASAVSQVATAGLYSYAPDGSSARHELDYCLIKRIVTVDALLLSLDGASSGDSRITRFSSDRQSSNVMPPSDDPLPTAMAFDGMAVFFYSSKSPRTIQRVPLGGSASLFVQEDEVTDMLADTTSLYALTVTGNLVAHPLAGGAPRIVASGLVGARRLAGDDAGFYVTAAGLTPTAGRVVRIEKSDGTARDLATNQASPSALVVEASGVYWLNSGDGSVMRALRR
jgi:hypothetical protein